MFHTTAREGNLFYYFLKLKKKKLLLYWGCIVTFIKGSYIIVEFTPPSVILFYPLAGGI
jgi:hypothetical protein